MLSSTMMDAPLTVPFLLERPNLHYFTPGNLLKIIGVGGTPLM
ncbi:MAG TPA: hypothetical protein VE399_11265 [Gemmatimonadales bacterium]|nr:hypothetical protein [Gemmatimonadales bacterium]